MAVGAGKYDKETTELRIRLNASGVLLMVMDGDRGSGVSLILQGLMEHGGAAEIAREFRRMADAIEADGFRTASQS